MKWLKVIGTSLFGIVVVLAGLQMFAAENGEVVVITTRDEAGAPHHTSVWIVESDGHQWLRSGSPNSGWYTRLSRTHSLEMQRNGAHAAYTVEAVPAQLPEINRLMHEKYGWADTYVGVFSPHSRAVPIRLDPAAAD